MHAQSSETEKICCIWILNESDMIGLGTRDKDKYINKMLGATIKEDFCGKHRRGQDELSLGKSGKGLAGEVAQKLYVS